MPPALGFVKRRCTAFILTSMQAVPYPASFGSPASPSGTGPIANGSKLHRFHHRTPITMSASELKDQNQLSELFNLLSSGLLEEHELQRALADFHQEVDTALQHGCDEEMAQAMALLLALGDHCASGDKVDELHDQVVEMFGGELPDFPDSLLNATTPDYLRWLDELLAAWNNQGGYEALSLDGHGGDDICLFAVHRQDADRVLHLAQTLGLRIERPLDFWRSIGA